MSAPAREQFSKLPKWAQDHIRVLEMRLREAKGELHEHLEKERPSEFAVFRPLAGHGGGGPEFAFLPKGETVACFLDNATDKDKLSRSMLTLRRGGDEGGYYLEVSAWSQYPSVQPQAANVVRVRLADKP